jgi:DNA-binding response OmpR family regulator
MLASLHTIEVWVMDLSRAPSPARLLALHEDRRFIGDLSTALQPRIPALTIDYCSTAREAKRLLMESPCHAVVVSPTLTMQGDVSVLTSSRRSRPPVPLIMTLRGDEREFAQDWLDLGVYDFIVSPFEPEEALQSIQEALLLSQIRAMILRTEEALLRLRWWREDPQTYGVDTSLGHEVELLLKQSIVRLEKSTNSLEETFFSLERTLKQLKQNRRKNELCAQQRAEQRLARRPIL